MCVMELLKRNLEFGHHYLEEFLELSVVFKQEWQSLTIGTIGTGGSDSISFSVYSNEADWYRVGQNGNS